MSTPEAPTFAGAAAATRALFDAPDTQAGAIPEPTQQAPSQTPVNTPDAGTTPEVATTETPALTWDSIDLSVLDPTTAQFVKEHGLRHSDYTRKTQELADQRKQFEQFGDVETVTQAMEFVQNLQDPDFLRQLNADITAHLGGTNPPDGQPQASTPESMTSPGLDPAIQSRLDRFDEYLAMEEHKTQQAELQNQLQTKLQTAEDAIKADNPTYTQDDIDKIYSLVPAHNYDLFAAREQYEEMRNYFTTALVGNKGTFPNAANSVRSDTLVTTPVDMNTMKSAKEATAALFAAQQ